MKAVLLAFALAPSVHPWPIGPGLRYLPPARPPAVVAGNPVGTLRSAAPGPAFRIHLELFANRKVVVVPAGIGVASQGRVYPVRTLAPGGIVEVARGSKLRLGDIFKIWGQPLRRRRLASFTSATPVRVYVAGRLVHAAAGSIPLTPHAEIVVELGAYVAPHPFFLFAGGDS